MIDRIGHVNIRTPLLEETLSFYEQLLDLKRGTCLTQPAPENVWLYADNGRAVIHVNVPPPSEEVPPVGSRGRVHHVAFDCRDYEAIVARLKAMNQAYMRHETPVDGLFLLTTVDPNGINVELSFGVDHAIDRSLAS
jgi:catechol 2,3-dioxygenase-like lactoylglutathione lyase family enzyme